MRKPRKGKENYEAGVELCEDILRMMLSREPGEDGVAVILTALALVNSYIRKGIGFTPAFDVSSDIKLIDQYQKLFQGDWWMGVREDTIQFQIEDFFRGKRIPMHNTLGLETEYLIKVKGLALALATEGTQEHINKKNQ
jgi:hypothetical protein